MKIDWYAVGFVLLPFVPAIPLFLLWLAKDRIARKKYCDAHCNPTCPECAKEREGA